MTALNQANRLYIGGAQASAAYIGSTRVWPPFKPTDIAGCAVWLDAAQLNLTNGANVTAWTNQGSGSQPVITGTPKYRTNALNTVMPCVRFNRGAGKIRMTGTGVDKDYTIIYVGRRWNVTNPGRVITARGTASNLLVGFHGYEGDVCYVEGWITPPQYPPANTLWKMYGADSTSTAPARFFRDGWVHSTGAATPSLGWGGTLNISGYNDDVNLDIAQECDCEVAEVVQYNRKLTDAERGQVERYLRAKWFPPLWTPFDLGGNCLGWFDCTEPSTVQVVGQGVNNWFSRVGTMVASQATDAWRPPYLSSGGVNFTLNVGLAVASGPASFDVFVVAKPNPHAPSPVNWRTMLRSAQGHEIILEDGSARLGIYNAGFFPATAGRVSPINMTSDAAPAPFVTSQSDTLNTDSPAWKAFDGVTTNYAHSGSPVSTQPYWIKIDLGAVRSVGWYKYVARHESQDGVIPYQQWKSWTLAGSNDNSTWTLVDTVTSVPNFALGEARIYALDVRAQFRYWRWTVTEGTGYTPPYACAAELELHDGLTWESVMGMAFARVAPSTTVVMSRDGGPLVSTGTPLAAGSCAPTTGFGALYMGTQPSQGFGNVKEVIFVPYGLESERQRVEGYLAHKWGLDMLLPADHPYKNAPPLNKA